MKKLMTGNTSNFKFQVDPNFNFNKGLHLSTLRCLGGWILSPRKEKIIWETSHVSKSLRNCSLWNLLFKILLFIKDIVVNRTLKKLPDGVVVVSNTLGIDFVCLWRGLVPASSEGPGMGTRQDSLRFPFFTYSIEWYSVSILWEFIRCYFLGDGVICVI